MARIMAGIVAQYGEAEAGGAWPAQEDPAWRARSRAGAAANREENDVCKTCTHGEFYKWHASTNLQNVSVRFIALTFEVKKHKCQWRQK